MSEMQDEEIGIVQVVRDVIVKPLLQELLESQQGPKQSESFPRVSGHSRLILQSRQLSLPCDTQVLASQ